MATHLASRLAFDSGEQTASATIHIAIKRLVGDIVFITDDAAFNVNKGVHSHMAILAATKHRAINPSRFANGHMGVFDESQIDILAAHAAVA